MECSELRHYHAKTWVISFLFEDLPIVQWALKALPQACGSFTGRQRQLYRTAAVKQLLSIERREEEDPRTERRTSTNGNTKVSGFSILRCLARDSYTSTRRSRALYESVPPQHLQALNFVIHSVCAIFACTFLRGFYP